jgi:hypothetical protein
MSLAALFNRADAPPAHQETIYGKASGWKARLRLGLTAGFILAAAGGYFAGKSGPAFEMEPELILLIRFMAFLKMLMAMGAALLVGWRLGQSPSAGQSIGGAFGVMIMAAGPALIWNINHLIVGSALFYGGLAMILCLDSGRFIRERFARR